MDAVALIRRLHQHRAWVNHNLLEAASRLSDEQLRRTFPIGQGSIWKSLVHLFAAEYVWLEALTGNETPVAPGDLPGKIPGNQEGANPLTGLADLKQQWSDLDRRFADYLAGLRQESLDDLVYKTPSAAAQAKRFGAKRSDVLLHVCTHAQYTTAQVVNMLRHCGVEKLPEVMVMAMARQEAQ
jgi:uncharacterized damage-inducible protein DinB